jgi:hypothetical protein
MSRTVLYRLRGFDLANFVVWGCTVWAVDAADARARARNDCQGSRDGSGLCASAVGNRCTCEGDEGRVSVRRGKSLRGGRAMTFVLAIFAGLIASVSLAGVAAYPIFAGNDYLFTIAGLCALACLMLAMVAGAIGAGGLR